MNRRQFTTRLAALFAAPALPASAVVAAARPVVAAMPAGATSWAQYLTAMHNTCTPAMLKSALNLNPKTAKTIHMQMINQGVIKDGNRVVHEIKQRLKSHLEADDMPDTRPANIDDLDALTDIWHDGWHEAHAAHVPNDLIELRDRNSFRIRLDGMLENIDVVGPIGAPVGFCAVQDDEIYQVYVAPNGRGNGTADALIKAGERRLLLNGIEVAQLSVLPENTRAQAFYRRHGWGGDVVIDVPLQTLDRPYMHPCLILTKVLKQG